MANNPFFADGGSEAAVAALCALMNSGTLCFYTSPQPADANTAITSQTKLCTLTFSATAFAAPTTSGSAGSRTVTAAANAIGSDTNAANTGTTAWFRAYKSDGTTAVLDGSAGTSGADINLSTTSIQAGGSVAVSAFSITQAE